MTTLRTRESLVLDLDDCHERIKKILTDWGKERTVIQAQVQNLQTDSNAWEAQANHHYKEAKILQRHCQGLKDGNLRMSTEYKEKIDKLEKLLKHSDVFIEALQESRSAKDCIIEAQKELIDELVPQKKDTGFGDLDTARPKDPIVHDADFRTLEERALAHIMAPTAFKEPTFCRKCGASIPHRFGEGRCPACMHHFDEDLLEKEPQLPEGESDESS